MRSPNFLGQAYVARSKTLADQQLINLYPQMSETKGAKDVAMFLGTPGLDLLLTLPTAPVRGVYPFNGLLYVVSGSELYSIDGTLTVTDLGPLNTETGPVSFINNGTQLAVFDGETGYLTPGGSPIDSATISSGGANYNVDDIITLVDANGPSAATAQVQVTAVSGGVVTGFSIFNGGAFNDAPVLSQASTSGGGSGFSLSSPVLGTFTNIYTLTLPFNNPTYANYQDGFGVCVQGHTTTVWQSNLFDLSIWDPLNFSDVEAQPTDLKAIGFLHRQLVMLQDLTAEVWINAGNSGFVFQEEQGVHIEVGIDAPFSLAQAGESLVWLGKNSQGSGFVVQMTGYEPVRISTYAIEFAIQNYSRTDDAIGYVYQQEGNVFYVLTFPTANATWVCDLSGQTKLWHQRAYFSNGQFSRHRSNCFAPWNGKLVVGDYQTGDLYAFNLDTYTDNSQSIKRLRSWRAIGQPQEQPTPFKYLWLDMQTGVNVTGNPQMAEQHSDDGGHTWSTERLADAGLIGQYGRRCKWNRLGSTRRGQGEDRIYQVSTTDAFAVAMIGAYQG